MSRWYWLLLIPIVLPLVTVIYNRVEPRLFGFPCFYWAQLSYVFVGVIFTFAVYRGTRGK